MASAQSDKNLTISKLAKKYGLSRSTLLYYDKIGLLSPINHEKGEYRTYGLKEQERLQQICLYRQAGVALKEIKQILDNEVSNASNCLMVRFKQLNQEIAELREQQRIIAGMLHSPSLVNNTEPMTKHLWTSLLKASGFSEEMMVNWHMQFEKSAPKEHQAFLEFLQIPDEEIKIIRNL